MAIGPFPAMSIHPLLDTCVCTVCQQVLLASSLLMLCYLMFCKYELPATITVHVKLIVVTASSICWGCLYLPNGSMSSKPELQISLVSSAQGMENHSQQFSLIQSTTLTKVRFLVVLCCQVKYFVF